MKKLNGPKQAILALAMNDNYLGFNRGPFRLIGGNLNSWNWLKNCCCIYITTAPPTTTPSEPPTSEPTTPPTSGTPGFLLFSTIVAISLIAIVAFVIKKKNHLNKSKYCRTS